MFINLFLCEKDNYLVSNMHLLKLLEIFLESQNLALLYITIFLIDYPR